MDTYTGRKKLTETEQNFRSILAGFDIRRPPDCHNSGEKAEQTAVR
jgi:hypothetical protein